ncbi:hypothetical protein [Streptomyces sp. NPDC048489]|uniref:hypothetical protein n=1 Tax=Streptomyces sp. NPDC048489 TaxID=3154504 RepID=UPI0034160D87
MPFPGLRRCRPEEFATIPDKADTWGFRCRVCGEKSPVIVEAENGLFFHIRDDDPKNDAPHNDIAVYAVVDGKEFEPTV